MSLKNPSGRTLSVPQEWTDREIPQTQPTILSLHSLLVLAELVKQRKAKKRS